MYCIESLLRELAVGRTTIETRGNRQPRSGQLPDRPVGVAQVDVVAAHEDGSTAGAGLARAEPAAAEERGVAAVGGNPEDAAGAAREDERVGSCPRVPRRL